MSAPVTVRPATPADVPELVAMIRELAEYERALPEGEPIARDAAERWHIPVEVIEPGDDPVSAVERVIERG